MVEKKVYFSERSKDKKGQLKEIIQQVSHSKKWQSPLEDGVMKMSYSKLQDDFWEYMRGADYDVKRGEKGSTKEHLSVLDFKIQQNTLLAMAQEEVIAEYDRQIDTKKEVVELNKKLEDIGKKAFGGVKMSS